MKPLHALLRNHELLIYGMACRWRNATWPQIAEMCGLSVPPVGYKTREGGYTRAEFSTGVAAIVRGYATKAGLPFPKRQYD